MPFIQQLVASYIRIQRHIPANWDLPFQTMIQFPFPNPNNNYNGLLIYSKKSKLMVNKACLLDGIQITY